MIQFYEELNNSIKKEHGDIQPDEHSTLDLVRMYQAEAELYWSAGNYLVEPNQKKDYIIPSILLLSYSCEIGLKSILELKNITYKKKHSINYLFELLDDTSKNSILSLFKIKFRASLTKFYPNYTNRIIDEVQNLTFATFTQKIKEYFEPDYFVSLRYRTPKSNNMYYPFALISFASAVKNYSGELISAPLPF